MIDNILIPNKNDLSQFTSKEWDEETKLYYMSARYQNPMTSRWISADPAGPELLNPMDDEGNLRVGFSVIEASNWYSYTSNCPVQFNDPTGMIGQKEKTYSGPMNYIGIFKDASFNGEEAIISSGSNEYYFSSRTKPNAYERIGRGFPTGMSDSKSSSGRTLDAGLSVIEKNISEATNTEYKLTVKTDQKKEKVLDWNLEMSVYENDHNSPGSGQWQKKAISNKNDALDVLLENPDLMYEIFDKTNIEE